MTFWKWKTKDEFVYSTCTDSSRMWLHWGSPPQRWNPCEKKWEVSKGLLLCKSIVLLFPSADCEEVKTKKWEEEPMALNASPLWGICTRFKPHLFMVIAQIGHTLLHFVTEASFNRGINPHVYVTYRHIVAGIFMSPLAFFLERYH